MKHDAKGRTATHETLTFERAYNAPPKRVFAAFADVESRARWGVPSDAAAIVFSEANFKVGGIDVSRCGGKDDLRFSVVARYGMTAALDNLAREFLS